MVTFKAIDKKTNETLLETEIDTSKNLSENSIHFAGTIEQARKLFVTNEELFDKISCALTHSVETCNRCKKCRGEVGAQIRMNMIEDLGKYMGIKVTWR